MSTATNIVLMPHSPQKEVQIQEGNNSITVTISQAGTQIGDSQIANATSGHFCFSGLLPGEYTVLVYFRHAGSDNAQPVNVPLTFTLTIQAPVIARLLHVLPTE